MAKDRKLRRISESTPLKIGVAIALGLFAATLSIAIFAAMYIPKSFQSFGEFGDFVGGVANPLLALMGYLALLYTIKLQLNELSLSREELALTREELHRSASALEAQVATSERQRLSQAFFDLFEMYKSVVADFEWGTKENRVTGKAALARKALSFNSSYMSNDPWRVERVRSIHKNLNGELGNYFRIIYRILSFLSDADGEAEFFADMFRAQLTTSELHLLFFNCVSDVGRPMQKFAAKFELFDNMPLPSGSNFAEIARELDRNSFGKNEDLLLLVSDK